jgi:hypothetical protein
MNESTLMMSSELQGLVPDLEDEPVFDYSNLTVVQCKIAGQDEPVIGQLVSVSTHEDHDLELRVGTRIALEIFKNVADITLEEIRVIYLDASVSLGGPFMINHVKIREVDQKSQSCIACLKLVRRIAK